MTDHESADKRRIKELEMALSYAIKRAEEAYYSDYGHDSIDEPEMDAAKALLKECK